MAQQTNSNNTKRGPGRPPGSKNKPKNTTSGSSSKKSSYSGNPTKQEVLDEMKRRSDRDKRNNDVIWSITLIAIALFLFFTVVMDTTGSFGMTVHDICNGLFGKMAFVLPFLVLIFALLLLGGKLSHINTRTAIFSLLIFINMCVLNSYRFIDPEDIRFGFKDMVDFYIYGVDGKKGGVIGMEIGSILAKLFGMPGLLIIAVTILIISIFMVANSPISRLAGQIGTRRETNRILREIEEDEKRKLTDEQIKAAIAADPSISASAEEKKPFWKSVISGIIREEEPDAGKAETVQAPAPTPSVSDIPKPFSSNSASRADNMDYTQIISTPVPAADKKLSRGTLFGKMKGMFAGIDSETGETVTSETLKKSEPSGNKGLNGDKSAPRSIYSDSRNFDSDDEDYGYPGKKRASDKTAARTGMGLGDPDEIVHSGSYGLDGHDKSGKKVKSTGLEPEETPKAVSSVKNTASAKPKASPQKTAAPKQEVTSTEASPEDAAISAGFNATTDDMSYELPPVSLLKKDTGSKQIMSDAQLQARAELLEQTLKDFGVDARVLKVTQGASVTRYEVQPATGVKVASITRLADDIALNLRAKSLRIEAPIPGKAAVGIEVENDKPAPVLIRDLIESEEFMEASSVIEFVVGKDISGNNIVADLRDMPHLLIAGATGSGKSVCINSIVTSFLYKARPSELKLIMIDPKVVELGNYNGIPHMLTPVVTDPRKAARALAIAVEEMEKRYIELNKKDDLSSYMLGFHAEYTCEKGLLEDIAAMANKYKAPVFAHISETKKEVEECKGRYGVSPIVLLDQMGMFNYGGGGYHLVHVSDEDIEIIKKRKMYVVTNPASNLKLASGIAPIKRYLDEKIPVAIGTDGPASNNCLDMFREMFLVTGLSKVREEDAACCDAIDVLKMATVNGAEAMGLEDCKYLTKGSKADLIMIDLSKPNMQPLHNIPKNIVYAGSKLNVALTMINGKVLYEDGQFNIGIDQEELYAKCNDLFKKIYGAAN